MKHVYVFIFVLFYTSIISVNAQDLIILRDGNVIESKVAEISPSEIKYRRFNHLDGPVIVIARADVLTIRYENKTIEIINPISVTRQERNQSDYRRVPQPDIQSNEPTLLQTILNQMPAIPIAGNNLKFEFRGETWIAKVNGENFSTGTIEFGETDEGCILTLKQTHIWPGAVGKTAGRVANIVPGGNMVSGALNTAGNIAGAAGAVEMSGPVIVLEYKAGPPSSLRLLSASQKDTEKTREVSNPTEKSANFKNNWMSYELAYIGLGIRYERMLGSKISLGVNAYLGVVFPYSEINTFLRVYPWGKTFFLGVGFGYYNEYLEEGHYIHHFDGNFVYGNSNGFTIIPEIGWKIDVGKPGGFYIMPCLTYPFVIGHNVGYRLIYFGMGNVF
ncbi:MAG: hypothetical protein FWB86_03345 [Treponema sp.]|nr:hypothetical protein [Treponema sp.]MCL2251192.1 hypothetical protein [Treponema sp.]